ncbi:MAG: DNA polymerase IV [Alistipes sp.]|jgi:DNA polymerase-4|nr:DNA polymerase IV [Alistipes sp.]
MRKIIHIDMDAFYASVEQRDNPAFRGQPLAVGYSGERGVVAAASYEARKYGVRSAMPSKTALKRCPGLIFTPGRFEVYKEVSGRIRDIFHSYTDLVEPLSLDEAYLDVTENKIAMPSATIIARQIKERIRAETGLTASAGVSVNKFLAKIASDHRKPDGLFVVTGGEAEEFVKTLCIEQFWGVGPATAERMHRLGIHTGADLRRQPLETLTRNFGKMGHVLYDFARGIDTREVEPFHIRKSIGAEETYVHDLDDGRLLAGKLRTLAEEVWRRVSRHEFFGRTVTLKVKYADFTQITRSHTPGGFVTDFEVFWSAARGLLEGVDFREKPIRLMGLSVGGAREMESPEAYQLEFDFPNPV